MSTRFTNNEHMPCHVNLIHLASVTAVTMHSQWPAFFLGWLLATIPATSFFWGCTLQLCLQLSDASQRKTPPARAGHGSVIGWRCYRSSASVVNPPMTRITISPVSSGGVGGNSFDNSMANVLGSSRPSRTNHSTPPSSSKLACSASFRIPRVRQSRRTSPLPQWR